MADERPIISPLKINAVIYRPPPGRPIEITGVGDIIEHEPTGTLEIRDRHSIAIRKFARGFWSDYEITSYYTPGDHVTVEDS